MKRLLILCSLLFVSILAQSQTMSTFNGTVIDTSSQAWQFGSATASLIGPFGVPGPLRNDGVIITDTLKVVSIDATGHFTILLDDVNHITPSGAKWGITVCPNASSPCTTNNYVVTGITFNQSITPDPPNVNAAPTILRAYSDTEVAGGNGALYWRTTDDTLRGCQALPNGPCTWVAIGSGGGGGSLPSGIPGQQVVYTGPTSPSTTVIGQNKPIYDVSDWMVCDGVTDASSGMNLLLSTIGIKEATIFIHGTTNSTDACLIGNTFFGANISLDFSSGGALKLISSSTPIGSGAYVSGTSVECGAGATCSLPAFSVTNGNTLVVMEAPYPGFTFKTTRITDDCGNFYIHAFQSLANQPRNQGAWIASNARGGTCTITATANGSLTTHMMLVAQISGMGPVTSLDTSASNNNNGLTMSSGNATTLTGAFLLAFGGQPFTFPETCTAGAGFTQPSGLAGQSSPNGSLCAEYRNASAGGIVNATQTITTNPSPGTWVYSLISLKPGNATATIWGGILNPDKHQIFYNADSQIGHGVVDFTGSNIIQDVEPEWWGACGACTATVNTPALQAAVWAAFGGGLTQRRTNASGLSIYNRPLRIGAVYQINDELKFYSVIGFKIYGLNRLSTGIQQTGTNKRIIDGQSISYGSISDLTFSTQATQDTSHALVDLDYNGIDTPNDLRPQFIDMDRVGFGGGGVASIGLIIAKSGGGAQGSNIYCRDCAASSFTEAAYQIGTHTSGATNALDIGFSGDIQGCPKFGIAVYSGGYVSFGGAVEEASMENGFSTQTGFDMYCETTQGPCSMDYVRSESRRLISGTDIVLHKTRMINQAAFLPPGQTFPVGSLMTGSAVAGDGAFYTVTSNVGAANGIGTPTTPLRANTGTSTTLSDTNQTISGSVTILKFGIVANESVTQLVTGATATVLGAPSSSATIAGTLNSGSFAFNDTAQQAVTGVTCTVGAGNTSINLNCSNFSGTADNSHIWTDLTTLATFTPSGAPVFSVSSMLITLVTGAPDNSHDWVGGTNGGHFTPTTVPINQANFTVNGFVGMDVSVLAGKNAGCYGTVTSNTAQTITFTGGWTTRYAKLGCPSPDTSSTFIVEPHWNHGTVVSGGMTMVYQNENAIDCQSVFGVPSCTAGGRLEDVIIAGGKIRVNPVMEIKNLIVYRQDWLDDTGGQTPGSCCEQVFDWDVRVASTVAPTVPPYQGTFYQNYSTPSIGGTSYAGANQRRLGTKALVWDYGNIGTNNVPANTSANSVWIGGRTDNGAGTDPTRNILEYGGMLGRGIPLPAASNSFNPVDVSGTDTDITGGPSRGQGIGGGINFYTSNPSVSSGDTPNSGKLRARVESNGLFSTTDGFFGSKEQQGPSPCAVGFATTVLSTIGTTSDTTLSCLPANSIIDAVVYRITTTITTAANFTIGDSVTAARFCTTQSTLTVGTTGVCFVQADQTGAAGPRQTTNQSVRVTTNVNPGAGAIRLIVYYHTWIPPTS